MKKLNLSRKTLLSVALLGSFAAAPFATPVAQADPPDHAPAYGRRAKDKKDKKQDKREERRDDKKQDRKDYNDNRDNEGYDRDRYDNDRDYRDRYNSNNANNRNNATFTGTVTNVRAGNSFDLRANGRTYNVYTTSGVPRGLSRGDEVRVYGRPYGANDIRNASVSIVRNQRNNNGRDNNGNGTSSGYHSYSGVVTGVRNNREFDIRAGGKIYNVYAASATRGLNKNDEVRIYGQRSGDNDIRNASAIITRNR